MLNTLHKNQRLQLMLGLLMGIIFGFLLQKGGVTNYDVIIGQLLLTNFTVVKIMLSAVLMGMLGIHILTVIGLAQLHPKPGSIGSSVLGGLIFGVGFGLLGYCPGTVAGAVGQGSLDALLGGVAGMLIGAGLFAAIYPKLERAVLVKGNFGDATLPRLLKVSPWIIIVPVSIVIIVLLFLIEKANL